MRQYPLLLVSLFAMFCPLVVNAYPSVNDLNIVILGDSNTSIGGDDCSDAHGWTKWFVEKINPKTCRSYARSGATWTNTSRTRYDILEDTSVLSDNNVIYNQMNRLFVACESGQQVSPDVIIIAAGTNDAWFSERRPGIFSTTVEQVFRSPFPYASSVKVSSVVSLAGSVRLVCDRLLSRFPNAQLFLLTPMQTVKASYEKISKVGDIIQECGRRMSIPVIRQDHITGVYPARETKSLTMTSDGTHTSADGARRNGFLIANQLAGFLCY